MYIISPLNQTITKHELAALAVASYFRMLDLSMEKWKPNSETVKKEQM